MRKTRVIGFAIVSLLTVGYDRAGADAAPGAASGSSAAAADDSKVDVVGCFVASRSATPRRRA